MKENSKKNYLIVILAVILFLMSTGYALFNNVLNVQAEGNIKSNWNVSFDSKNYITRGSTFSKEVSPVISDHSIYFDVTFEEENQYIEYTFYILNKGNINAELLQIAVKDDSLSNIEFVYRVRNENNQIIYDSEIGNIQKDTNILKPNSRNVVEVEMRCKKMIDSKGQYQLEFRYGQVSS